MIRRLLTLVICVALAALLVPLLPVAAEEDAKTASVVSFSIVPSPAVRGQLVSITGTVSPVPPLTGTPTGNITLRDGTVVLYTGNLSGGAFNYQTASLSVGSHNITAIYTGDEDYSNAAAGPAWLVVNKASTSTSVVSSVNPSSSGQSVTFAATVNVVAPGGGAPSGVVTFRDGLNPVANVTLNASRQASYTAFSMSAGYHSITASYEGNSEFNGSTSPALDQLVNKKLTNTALASSLNPATHGETIDLIATVKPVPGETGEPTGTVTFTLGFTVIGTSSLNGTGQAVRANVSLPVGNNPLTATYSGDANYSGSTSPTLVQTVTKASTNTTLTSSANPSLAGQIVMFTANITVVGSGSTAVSGTVTFKDGPTVLATVPVTGFSEAAYSTSALAVGGHSITAAYEGSSYFEPSTSGPLSQVVNKASTNTLLTSSVNPSSFGQTVVFTANVTAIAPGGGVPSGTVSFMAGASLLGTAALNASGQATYTAAALPLGSHTVTALYPGDSNYNPSSSAAVVQQVNQASTITTLASSSNPSSPGQLITLTALVTSTPPGAGIPSGTVTFKEGSTVLASVSLNGQGRATYSTSTFNVGTHPLTAVYAGNSQYASSTSTPLNQIVVNSMTVTSLASSASPVVHGQSVTLTATVLPVPPVIFTPTGSVIFKDGAITLGSVALSSLGQAVYTTSTLSTGTHALTAVYSGDANYSGSTSPVLNQVVNKASTFTTLVSALNPSTLGQSVAFSATVVTLAPGAGIPAGTVAFKDGTAVLGRVTLNAAGQAAFATSALTAGSHTVTAVYEGNVDFAPSSSATLTQLVSFGAGVRGDANGDGFINMGDVTRVESIILGLAPATYGADANADGSVNMGDVTKIELIILGIA